MLLLVCGRFCYVALCLFLRFYGVFDTVNKCKYLYQGCVTYNVNTVQKNVKYAVVFKIIDKKYFVITNNFCFACRCVVTHFYTV